MTVRLLISHYNLGIDWRVIADTILRIPKEQAALLLNGTLPIIGDLNGYYIAQIEMFRHFHRLVTSSPHHLALSKRKLMRNDLRI